MSDKGVVEKILSAWGATQTVAIVIFVLLVLYFLIRG